MISLSEYSDKSFVINGSTIDYKNKLKELGGKWNPYLKSGPGWIFSNKRKASVQEWMNTIENSPVKKRKLNNKENIKSSVNNSQILKETVFAIFIVSLIYCFNKYDTVAYNILSSGRDTIQDTLNMYLSSGRFIIAQTADTLKTYVYKFNSDTPIFVNKTC